MYLNASLTKLISQWRDKPEYGFLMVRNNVHVIKSIQECTLKCFFMIPKIYFFLFAKSSIVPSVNYGLSKIL